MAEAERKLANGAKRVDFATEPTRYRHWKLAVDGEVATLMMDVDEQGGLFEGYELKLNSYDLSVDIELADVPTVPFERRASVEHGLVLGANGDDVLAVSDARLGYTS